MVLDDDLREFSPGGERFRMGPSTKVKRGNVGSPGTSAKENNLVKKIQNREARIGIIGLGYVGLPLVIAFGKTGFDVTGFDISKSKVESLNAGKSYIRHIDISELKNSSFFRPPVISASWVNWTAS